MYTDSKSCVGKTQISTVVVPPADGEVFFPPIGSHPVSQTGNFCQWLLSIAREEILFYEPNYAGSLGWVPRASAIRAYICCQLVL